MKKGSTLVLKFIICLMGVAALAICVFAFPSLSKGIIEEWPGLVTFVHIAFIGLYATALPFLFALYQAFKLLHLIEKGNAFSEGSVQALRMIKFCAMSMTALYMLSMPMVFGVAELDDAPGAVLIGFSIACLPLIVATFAALLQRILKEALDIKSENNLTI